MSKELVFVGYTNGSQIFNATEQGGGLGGFYCDNDNDCCIPLYMLKTHLHRIETTSGGLVTAESIGIHESHGE